MSVSEDARLAVMLGMLPGSLLMAGVGILILPVGELLFEMKIQNLLG